MRRRAIAAALALAALAAAALAWSARRGGMEASYAPAAEGTASGDATAVGDEAESMADAFAPGLAARPVDLEVPRARSLEVRVVDASGAPVAGATVAVGDPIRGRLPDLLDEAKAIRTDAEGRAAVPLPEAVSLVSVISRLAGQGAAYLPHVPADRPAVLTLAANVSIVGTVTRQDQRPAAGILVVFDMTRPVLLRAATRTAADGSFRLGDLCRGRELPASRGSALLQGHLSVTGEGLAPVVETVYSTEPEGDEREDVTVGEGWALRVLVVRDEPTAGDADPAPISGAVLRAVHATGVVLAEARSDAGGRATLKGLPPDGDDPLVEVRAAGFAPQCDSPPHPEWGAPATLVFALSPAGTVSGVVLDEDGNPAAGASVLHEGRARATSDALGRFEATDVPAYRCPVELVATRDGAKGEVSVPMVEGGRVEGVAIRLTSAREGPPVRGRVAFADGRAAPGARVAVFLGPWAWFNECASAVTDERGEFDATLPPLAKDGVRRHVWISAYIPGWARAWADVGGFDGRPVALTLQPSRTLSGRVLWEDGAAGPGLRVLADAVDSPRSNGVEEVGVEGWFNARKWGYEPIRSPSAWTWTRADGSFVLEDVPPEPVVVSATHSQGLRPHWAWCSWRPEPRGDEPFVIRLHDRNPSSLPPSRPKGPRLVVLAAGSDRLPARVTDYGIERREDAGWAAYDGNSGCWHGDGEVARGLPPGTYRLRARGLDFATFEAEIMVPEEGAPATLQVPTRPGAAVVGRVVLPEGLAPEDVTIRLSSLTDRREQRQSVEEDGALVVRHVVAGRYRAEVDVLGRRQRFAVEPSTLEFSEEEVSNAHVRSVTWRLVAATHVRVAVGLTHGQDDIDAGAPLLEAWTDGGDAIGSWACTTDLNDDDEEWRNEEPLRRWRHWHLALPPGDYRLRVVREGTLLKERRVTVPPSSLPFAVRIAPPDSPGDHAR